MFWKTLLTTVFAPLLALPLLGAIVDRKVLAMGTELRLHLPATPGAEAALAECLRIETACSTWNPPSRWSLLNAAQGGRVPMEPEWLALLAQMKAWHLASEGAFNPVLMPLVRAWDTRGAGRVPTPEARRAALEACDPAGLNLDPERGVAWLEHPDAGVEEGGFLKGYALDRMRKVSLALAGWLDFGGQVLAWGPSRRVAVADPLDRTRPRLTLRLKNASLACSATTERGRHILDPRTGLRCEAWGATAVVAREALTADVLSTALYVLGPDQGLRWAEAHGVAAVFLLNHGEVRMSRAFRRWHPKLMPKELS